VLILRSCRVRLRFSYFSSLIPTCGVRGVVTPLSTPGTDGLRGFRADLIHLCGDDRVRGRVVFDGVRVRDRRSVDLERFRCVAVAWRTSASPGSLASRAGAGMGNAKSRAPGAPGAAGGGAGGPGAAGGVGGSREGGGGATGAAGGAVVGGATGAGAPTAPAAGHGASGGTGASAGGAGAGRVGDGDAHARPADGGGSGGAGGAGAAGGGDHSAPVFMPARRATAEDFVMLKTVGKGSFGKVVMVRPCRMEMAGEMAGASTATICGTCVAPCAGTEEGRRQDLRHEDTEKGDGAAAQAVRAHPVGAPHPGEHRPPLHCVAAVCVSDRAQAVHGV